VDISSHEIVAIVVGASFAAGLNVYATVATLGILGHAGLLTLPRALDPLASWYVIGAAGALFLIEFVADKIPTVDHIWDIVHTFIRPAAGALVAYAAVSNQIPRGAVIIATILAGSAALGAHATKATVRGVSTLSTGGLGNPILSLIEDVFAFASAIIAILLPWLIVVVAALVILFFVARSRRADNFSKS
jgi:hypothetical protein